MKKMLPLACMLSFVALSGCQYVDKAQQDIGTITTSLPVACQSAKAIVQQFNGAGLSSAQAAKAQADIDKGCNKAAALGIAVQSALPLVNTAASLILSIAGQYGYHLPGVPGLK